MFSILDGVFVSKPSPPLMAFPLLSGLSSSSGSERQQDIDREEIALPDNETLKEKGGWRTR